MKDLNGIYDLLFCEDGETVNRLIVDNVYDMNTDLSVQYEHTSGLSISIKDADRLGVYIEKN